MQIQSGRTVPLRDGLQTMEQRRIEVPCVNDDAERIHSANYEPDLNLQIYFLVQAASLFTLRTFVVQFGAL
jgi:hypothetical protein